ESYELTMYVAARHTALDCVEKRGRKGYLFMIGDEMAYPVVRRAHVQKLIGTDPQDDMPLRQIIEETREKYHLYFVISRGAAHGQDRDILRFWTEHLGKQSVLKLQDPNDTAECIAMTIGLQEGVGSLDPPQPHRDTRATGPRV